MSEPLNEAYFEIESILNNLSLKYTQIGKQNEENLKKFQQSEQIVEDLEHIKKLEDTFITTYGFDKLKELNELKNEYNINEEYVVNEVLNIQSINRNISKTLYNRNHKKVEPIFMKLILGLSFIRDNKENLKNIDLENLTFQFKKSLIKLLSFVNKDVLNNKFTIMGNRFKPKDNEEDLLLHENLISFVVYEVSPFFKMTSVIETYFNQTTFFSRDVPSMNTDLFNRYFKERYERNYKKLELLLKQLEDEDKVDDKQLQLTNFNNDLNTFIIQEYEIYNSLLSYSFKKENEPTVLNEENELILQKKTIDIDNSVILNTVSFNDRFIKYLQAILNDLLFLKKFNNFINNFSLDDIITGVYSYNRYFEYDEKEIEGNPNELLNSIDYKSLVRPLLENFHIRLFKLIKSKLCDFDQISKETLLSVFDLLVKIYDILPLSAFTNFLNYILPKLLEKEFKNSSEYDEEAAEKNILQNLTENVFFILVIQNFIKNFELDIDALNDTIPFDNVSLTTATTISRPAKTITSTNSIDFLSSVFSSLVSSLIKNEIESIFNNRFEIHSDEDYLKLNEFLLIDLKKVYLTHYKNLQSTLEQLNEVIDDEEEPLGEAALEQSLTISLAVPDEDISEFLSNYKTNLDFQILSIYSQLSKINGEKLVSLDTLKEAIEL